MNEKKSLEQDIIDDLKSTGYPTELISASILKKNDWYVHHNLSFWDIEEKQSREYDLMAYKQFQGNGTGKNLAVYLIIECKKSDNPWVFFVSTDLFDQPGLGRYIKIKATKRVFCISGYSDELFSDDYMRTNLHYFQHPLLARTFYEPLKGKENASRSPRIYAAVMSAMKATLFHHSRPAISNFYPVYYPVIIFNGPLFQAKITSDQEIELKSSSHIRLAFNYIKQEPEQFSTAFSAQEQFIIDVVSLDYLRDFLPIINHEHQNIADELS